MSCQPRHDLRRRPPVILYRLRRPPRVGGPRRKRVQCQTAFVDFTRAGRAEDGAGDEAARGGFGDGDGFVAGLEELDHFGEDLADGGWREVGFCAGGHGAVIMPGPGAGEVLGCAGPRWVGLDFELREEEGW